MQQESAAPLETTDPVREEHGEHLAESQILPDEGGGDQTGAKKQWDWMYECGGT